MNKNKKISTYLTLGALVFVIVAMFMGFAGGWTNGLWKDGKWASDPITIKFWDIIFNKNKILTSGFGGKTNAALIVTFVLTLISILTLAAIVVLNFTNKSTKNLNKGLMITLIVVLFIVAILMVASKAICGVSDEISSGGTTIKNTLAAGPICWSVFSLVGAIAMIVAVTQNKKAFAKA